MQPSSNRLAIAELSGQYPCSDDGESRVHGHRSCSVGPTMMRPGARTLPSGRGPVAQPRGGAITGGFLLVGDQARLEAGYRLDDSDWRGPEGTPRCVQVVPPVPSWQEPLG